MIPNEYSFIRYLTAKKSVDDRALNRPVWHALARELPTASQFAPLQVLEVGAGIGTMLERMLEWGLFTNVDYTGVDSQTENIAYVRDWLPSWAGAHAFHVETCSPESWLLIRDEQQVAVRFEAMDVYDFIAREADWQKWDLLVGHAFLDLLDIPTALPLLLDQVRSGGLFYFSVNFDGLTLLEPVLDPGLDEKIQALYHRTMDERITDGRPSGDSRAGRHLFAHLKSYCAGRRAQLLAAGASDWVVFSQDLAYPEDEAYFLHFIIHTISQALKEHPELDAARFDAWMAERHQQIERGELVYIAHQLDITGKILTG